MASSLQKLCVSIPLHSAIILDVSRSISTKSRARNLLVSSQANKKQCVLTASMYSLPIGTKLLNPYFCDTCRFFLMLCWLVFSPLNLNSVFVVKLEYITLISLLPDNTTDLVVKDMWLYVVKLDGKLLKTVFTVCNDRSSRLTVNSSVRYISDVLTHGEANSRGLA